MCESFSSTVSLLWSTLEAYYEAKVVVIFVNIITFAYMNIQAFLRLCHGEYCIHRFLYPCVWHSNFRVPFWSKCWQWDAESHFSVLIWFHEYQCFFQKLRCSVLQSFLFRMCRCIWFSNILDVDICLALLEQTSGFCVKINVTKCYTITHLCFIYMKN